MVISDTDYMTNISLTENFTSGLRVTTGHKYEFKFGLDFPEDFAYGFSVHFNTFADIIFKKEVILFLLDSMTTKVQNFDRLVHPVMKLVHGGWLSYVLNLTLNIF